MATTTATTSARLVSTQARSPGRHRTAGAASSPMAAHVASADTAARLPTRSRDAGSRDPRVVRRARPAQTLAATSSNGTNTRGATYVTDESGWAVTPSPHHVMANDEA